jgi:hypothetical protein
MALLGGEAVPGVGVAFVGRLAALADEAELVLRLGLALRSGFEKPLPCGLCILGDAGALQAGLAHGELGVGVS